MIKNFVVYIDSGEILRSGSCPNTVLEAQAQVGELVIEGSANDEIQYVESETIKDKAALGLIADKPQILADGVDTATINNIPVGVFVTWPDGEREEVTDGVVEFSVTQPGVYSLTFDGVKFLKEAIEIEANT